MDLPKDETKCSFPLDHEVIQVLRCFHFKESYVLYFIRDHEGGDRVEEHLGMKEYLFRVNLVFIIFVLQQHFLAEGIWRRPHLTRERVNLVKM